MPKFEWDEAERLSNVAKHRLDFLRVRNIFDGRPRTELDSQLTDEPRLISTAELDGRIITVIFVRQGESIRLISARGARDGEKREYREHRAFYGG